MQLEPSAPPAAEGLAKRRPMSSAVVPTTGIRTVFLDVDGTLVTYENVLPDSAAWAIREARRAGHRVYACTGRSRAEMPEAIWAIGLDGMIGGNGAYVEDDGEVLLHQHLSAAQCEQAVSWLRRRGLEPYLETNSGLYASPAFRDAARPAIRAYAIGKGAAGASSMEVDGVLPGMVFTDEHAMTSTRSAFCCPLLRTIWRRLVASSLTWSSAPGVAVATSRSSGM